MYFLLFVNWNVVNLNRSTVQMLNLVLRSNKISYKSYVLSMLGISWYHPLLCLFMCMRKWILCVFNTVEGCGCQRGRQGRCGITVHLASAHPAQSEALKLIWPSGCPALYWLFAWIRPVGWCTGEKLLAGFKMVKLMTTLVLLQPTILDQIA